MDALDAAQLDNIFRDQLRQRPEEDFYISYGMEVKFEAIQNILTIKYRQSHMVSQVKLA